jgi:GWxTD domain-containing protein
MKQKIFATILTVFLSTILVQGANPPHQEKEKISRKAFIKQLDEKYRNWLDLTTYIITPLEEETFFKLTNNKDRDAFITLFWNLRDPTDGTPENEFKDEHIKRFNHANRYFSYGTPLPGWKTDRGKIYILLGPPVAENEVFKSGLYPVLIWDYYGGVDQGLPTMFNVVFYKRRGTGDYQLYVPVIDRPESLLQTGIGQIDPSDYYSIYEKIKDIEPAVADVAFTLVPGEDMTTFTPSLHSPILMAQIYDLPKKRINATYARNFLNYKGIVETSVITNYINARSDFYIIKDPGLNLNFAHFALRPDRLSVDYSPEKDQYYFNFTLTIVVKKGEDIILEYNKNYPFYYSKDALEAKLSDGIIIADYFPVIEGDYNVFMVLQNSVNKEICYFEKSFKTTEPSQNSARAYGPFISYQPNQPGQPGFSAFNIMGTSIKIDPKQTFGLKESLYSTFFVDRGNYTKKIHTEMDVVCTDEARPYSKTYSFDIPEGKQFHIITQNLEALKYGNYLIKTRVIGEDNTVLFTGENSFMISPLVAVPHPPSVSKMMKPENYYLFYTMIADQYQNIRDIKKAEQYFEKAYRINPSFPGLVKLYANFLYKQENYAKMLEVIENLAGNKEEAFDYYSLKGRALYSMGSYLAAQQSLLEANKIYDSDIFVLNALGFSFIQTGEIEEAKKVLAASLLINPDQDTIKEALERIKSNEKNKPKKK